MSDVQAHGLLPHEPSVDPVEVPSQQWPAHQPHDIRAVHPAQSVAVVHGEGVEPASTPTLLRALTAARACGQSAATVALRLSVTQVVVPTLLVSRGVTTEQSESGMHWNCQPVPLDPPHDVLDS
jgi:hypothetical protein